MKSWEKLKPFYRNKSFRSTALILVVSSVLLVGALYLFESLKAGQPKREDVFPNMSIYHEGSTGTMALWEFLQAAGLKPGKIVEPLVDFYARTEDYVAQGDWMGPPQDTAGEGVILVIGPDTPFTADEISMFYTLASNGFTFIVFSPHTWIFAPFISPLTNMQDALSEKSLEYLELTRIFTNGARIVKDGTGVLGDAGKLFLPGESRFSKWSMKWDSLLSDQWGTIALEHEAGEGRIVLFCDSGLLSNLFLREGDNGVFIYRLVKHYAKGGAVYIDEYHHGVRHSLTIFYFLAKPEFRHLIVQALLFLLVFFYAKGIRFGQYRYPAEAKNEKIYYYSEGMAGLLGRRRYADKLLPLARANLAKLGTLLPQRYPKAAIDKALEESEAGDTGGHRADPVKKLKDLYRSIKEL
ncbi:MAG: hypothetical protein A2Y33_06760 [Spirochaetes bacterium GWF1_51_8]|nr:MAG: hypothetical protein A2Y33_06760 [Spirochaetes bacterium GWF1_51_8]